MKSDTNMTSSLSGDFLTFLKFVAFATFLTAISINTAVLIPILRAGNEKDGDEQADTVGCCSLRVEHIELHDQKVSKCIF